MKENTMKNKEQGFILLITLVWLMTLSALVVGILSSTRSSLKNEKRWVGMDECYMYGRMALSSARVEIIADSQSYFDDNVGELGAFKSWYDERLPVLKTELAAATALAGTDPLGKDWPVSWQEGTYTAKITETVYSDRRIDFLLEVVATLNGGQRAFEQHFVIKMGAAIFDYAYFINNNGWLHSTATNTFYVNGNIGSNANFSLAGQTVLNGTVFAAKRKAEEIRDPNGNLVNGWVTDKDGNKDSDGYTSQDKTAYLAWLSKHPEAIARAVLDPTNGTNSPNDDLTAEQIASSLLYNPDLIENNQMPATEEATALKMPFLGELASYAKEAAISAGKGWSRLDYIDENGTPQSITNGVINGNLIINGPFQIMGKIVVKGDLIIRGTYDGITDGNLAKHDAFKGNLDGATEERLAAANGKGGFFVDRNINIIGDLKSSTGKNGEEDPFLSLAARGNIIMGDTRYIDMGLISNKSTDTSGQMVPYTTDDSMYQNLDDTKFNGNYSLPEIGAGAGESGAVGLGTGNVHQAYRKITTPGLVTVIGTQKQIKETRTGTRTKTTTTTVLETGKVTTDEEEETKTENRWVDAGLPTTKSIADEIVLPTKKTSYTTWDFNEWVKVSPEVSRVIEITTSEPDTQEYKPMKNKVIIATDPTGLPGQAGSSHSLLWKKVGFWKNNRRKDKYKVSIKINDDIHTIVDVNSYNQNRLYNATGEKIRGYQVTLSNTSNITAISKGSATVDRSYFENKMDIHDYWKLKPKAPKRIDAVLYTNHLVAGSMKRNGSINGALVARDEALKIIKGNRKSEFSFNWDTRLGNNEFSENSYLQQSMEALMPATLGGKGSKTEDGVVFTREVNISN